MSASIIKLQEQPGFHCRKSDANHAKRLGEERIQRRKAQIRQRVRMSAAVWPVAAVFAVSAAFGTAAASAMPRTAAAAPVHAVHVKPHARAPRFAWMNPGHIVEYFLVRYVF